MSVDIPGETQRFLIPRWRTFGESAQGLASLDERALPERDANIDEALDVYESDPGPFTAGDLVSQAVVKGVWQEHREPLDDAARLLAASGVRAAAATAAAARSGFSPETAQPDLVTLEDWRVRVAINRRILLEEPRNAIRWADLALGHLSLGNVESSMAAIMVARALAPSNRYVLRAIARMASITGELRWARRAIADSGSLNDPWILAADVSLADIEGRPSRNMKRARAIADSTDIHPAHLSELRGALSVAQMRSGADKAALREARRSLMSPTENAVAQAEWSRQNGLRLNLEDFPDTSEIGRTYEAESRRLVSEGKLSAALAQARLWLVDQPIAPEAAMFASWLASTTEDFDVAIEAAMQGLSISPSNHMLRNNLAYALILSDRIAEAELHLAEIDLRAADSVVAATVEATRGLLAFRSGDVEGGHRSYEAAARAFRLQRHPAQAALAAMLHANEALLAADPSAAKILAAAVDLAARTDDLIVEYWLARIKSRWNVG